ncbi:hypothetical protein BZA05DRAFT_50289 [Tricharina praecox]|uniref:uncharacterized protein n=1 Tax=Tricharina praecox TaxID=43433 RepID=UPI00221E5FD9|nr:uncharacterized protein BZA05DRAFT_50289 [Tricharina praecox]KAI5852036.1 hypothetical protein BZA05DRAFT_50289 [Tricharina praecox]
MDGLQAFRLAKGAVNDGRTSQFGYRIFQLQKLFKLLQENEKELIAAIAADTSREVEDVIRKPFRYCVDASQRLFKLYKLSAPRSLEEAGSQSWLTMFRPDPLSSLLIPLIFAIEAGSSALLAPSPGRTSSLLASLLPRYLDREAYIVISTHTESAAFQQLAVNTVITTGRRLSIPQRQIAREVGPNIICILDTGVDLALAAAGIKSQTGLCSPAAILCLPSLCSELASLLGRSAVEKVEQPLHAKKKTLGIGGIIPTTSTEEALLILDGVEINRFTYLGTQAYGEYMLKFLPAVRVGLVNSVRGAYYDDISADDFLCRRSVVSEKRLESGGRKRRPVGVMPDLKIKHTTNFGFFDQGALLGLGTVVGTVVCGAALAGYKLWSN